MDKYKVKIRNRMTLEVIGTIVFIPVAVYALFKYINIEGVVSGTPVKDFVGGVLNGQRAGYQRAFQSSNL